MTGYIWVTLQLVGSLEDWRTAYEWYGSLYSTARIAQREGEALLGHDDFVVGHVVDGRLVQWAATGTRLSSRKIGPTRPRRWV